jgi:hypothetical protein
VQHELKLPKMVQDRLFISDIEKGVSTRFAAGERAKKFPLRRRVCLAGVISQSQASVSCQAIHSALEFAAGTRVSFWRRMLQLY